MTNQTNSNTPSGEQEITLRCSKCGKPITPAEAIQTPIGYRCGDCVRTQQKVFDTSKPLDYLWGFLIAVIGSFLASYIIRMIGFFTFLLAPAAGVGIAEVVRLVIKKRRSKRLFQLVAAGIILGGLPLILLYLSNMVLGLQSGSGPISLFSLLPIGFQILYLVLAVPSAYYRLSGNRRS